MTKSKFLVILILFAIHLLLEPVPAIAERLRFTPSISAKTGYDDNILFNFEDKVSDTYVAVKPEIKGDYGTQALQFRLDAYIDAYRYSKEKELDVENYRVGLLGSYDATQRLSVTATASYLNDTTLDSELEDTGRVTQRDNRERYKGMAGIDYALNEVSGLELEYEFIRTLYENSQETSNPRVDRDSQRLTIPYYWWVNNRLDRLSLGPSFTNAETDDDTTIEYYNLSLGWIHVFDRTLLFNGLAGYGYTVTTENNDERVRQIWNADISLTKSGETISYRTGYKANIRLSTVGELLQVDRLYFDLSKRVTERFRFNFYCSIYASRPVEEFETVDRLYYDLKPEIRYSFTKNLSSSLFYRYSTEHNNELENNPDRARNVVELRLDYRMNFEK